MSKETADGLYTVMAGVHTTAVIGGAIYGMRGTGASGENAGSIKMLTQDTRDQAEHITV